MVVRIVENILAQIKQTKNVGCVQGCGISKHQGCVK